MKTSMSVCVVVAAALVSGAYGDDFQASPQHHETTYRIVELSSLGGTNSRGNSINNLGWVAGFSNRTGNQSRHASLWIGGFQFDLGTLGGPNSNVAWPVKNTQGLIAGIAQTTELQHAHEEWSCRIFFPGPDNTRYRCLGVAWEWGIIRALPTLGAPGSLANSFATGVNNRRQIVGWSENNVADSTCAAPQVFQFRAVVWGPGRDQIRDLPLFDDDNDTSSAATAINDRGQIVGISGTCDQAVGRLTAKHAVLWEDGRVKEIENIGGGAWNTPMAINQRGDVAGFLGLPGDDPYNPSPNFRGFYWTKPHGTVRIDPFSDHVSSEAHGLNERGQVVGASCPAEGECRGFVWKNGELTDLNKVSPGYTRQITTAQDINDWGMITGRAFDPVTKERPAIIAFPISRKGSW